MLAMADHMLALEVLRELDEAEALYFALAILSPSSLEHLVSLSGLEVASVICTLCSHLLCAPPA